MEKELQLVDFIEEFSSYWNIFKDLKKSFEMTMEQLQNLGGYDLDYITEYFEGNYEDVIAIAEGRL